MEFTYKLLEEQERVAVFDGDEEIGEITWIGAGKGVINVNHTFVEPKHRGGKIALKLVEMVVDYAKANNLKIKPTCPYVVKVFSHSEEFQKIQA